MYRFTRIPCIAAQNRIKTWCVSEKSGNRKKQTAKPQKYSKFMVTTRFFKSGNRKGRKMEEIYTRLVENIERLRKNKENVPLPELRTKYAKPYRDLICTIKNDSDETLKICIFAGCRFGDDEKGLVEEFFRDSQKIIDQEKKRGTFKKISEAIFQKYSINDALQIAADRIGTRIWYEAYQKIWLQHTKPEGFTFRNDLIGMTWNNKESSWQKEEKGVVSWTLMLPPTEEEIERDYRDECKRIQGKFSGKNDFTGYQRRKQYTA